MVAKELENPFTNLEHDHASCVVEALNAAKVACKKSGERLTPLRLKVLELKSLEQLVQMKKLKLQKLMDTKMLLIIQKMILQKKL